MNEESRGGEGERRACRAMSIFPPGKNGKFVGIPSALPHSLSSPLFLLHARLCKIVRWIRKRGRSWINRSSRCAYFPPRKNDAGGQAFKVMYEGNWTIRFERQISDATLSRERERLDQGCNAVWT